MRCVLSIVQRCRKLSLVGGGGLKRMINNSQYMKIIQYLSILGGLEPPPPAARFLRLCKCVFLIVYEQW